MEEPDLTTSETLDPVQDATAAPNEAFQEPDQTEASDKQQHDEPEGVDGDGQPEMGQGHLLPPGVGAQVQLPVHVEWMVDRHGHLQAVSGCCRLMGLRGFFAHSPHGWSINLLAWHLKRS